MITKQFPLKSSEFQPGSPQYNEYISCIEKVSVPDWDRLQERRGWGWEWEGLICRKGCVCRKLEECARNGSLLIHYMLTTCTVCSTDFDW